MQQLGTFFLGEFQPGLLHISFSLCCTNKITVPRRKKYISNRQNLPQGVASLQGKQSGQRGPELGSGNLAIPGIIWCPSVLENNLRIIGTTPRNNHCDTFFVGKIMVSKGT